MRSDVRENAPRTATKKNRRHPAQQAKRPWRIWDKRVRQLQPGEPVDRPAGCETGCPATSEQGKIPPADPGRGPMACNMGRSHASPSPSIGFRQSGPAGGRSLPGNTPLRRGFWNPPRSPAQFLSAASKLNVEGSKLMRRTNSYASAAPAMRSMPLSSHSTHSGPW